MAGMTTHERFNRMFNHKEADRMAIWDFPWPGTIARWHREGMPDNVSFEDYFDTDRISRISVNNSPRFPEHILEDNDKFITKMTCWGCKERNFKHEDSTPDFMDYTIINKSIWLSAKEHMTPADDRIPWDTLKANYSKWRKAGHWILADCEFGFNHFLSNVVGTERLLIAMVEEHEWVSDMLSHSLELDIALLDRVWDSGYTFDMFNIREDMGYSYSQFFSVQMYREIIKPIHQRAVDWAHSKGAKVRLHSCGNINPFLPEIVDVGFDALHPLEVKANMKPDEIKLKYGNRLTLHGGFNAMLWKDYDAIAIEMNRLIPILKQNGGYIFGSDHSIPNDVSFENMVRIMDLAKELGRYE